MCLESHVHSAGKNIYELFFIKNESFSNFNIITVPEDESCLFSSILGSLLFSVCIAASDSMKVLKSLPREQSIWSLWCLTASNNAFYFLEGDKMKLRMQRLCKAINSWGFFWLVLGLFLLVCLSFKLHPFVFYFSIK